MIKYFEVGNFDTKKFIENQRSIMMQWETDESVFKSEKNLIDRFSLYMAHICDELFEADLAAKEFENDRDEYFKELTDVAMYIASASNLFPMYYEYLYSKNKENNCESYIYKESKNFRKFDFTTVSITMARYSFEDLATTVITGLSSIREAYPQRKWHKISEGFDYKTAIEVLTFSFNRCLEIIEQVIEYILVNINYDYDYLNNLINEKQHKILGDAFNGTAKNVEKDIIEELLNNCDVFTIKGEGEDINIVELDKKKDKYLVDRIFNNIFGGTPK